MNDFKPHFEEISLEASVKSMFASLKTETTQIDQGIDSRFAELEDKILMSQARISRLIFWSTIVKVAAILGGALAIIGLSK